MSDLYRLYVLEIQPEEHSLDLRVEAVNNEDQALPDAPVFYFAMLAAIYWSHQEQDAMAAFCVIVETWGNQQVPHISCPHFEEFISVTQAFAQSWEPELLRPYHARSEAHLAEELKVEILDTELTEHGLQSGQIRLKVRDADWLQSAHAVAQFSTTLGPDGLGFFL